ncbi:hypothetical protein [Streptomyces sp. WAC08241]|uniref:hypothetical protein n=1 Tax=Streptomyces sp. WAC08241 TaxID=2487421 RepID=UPI000F76BFE4|nr:hypothetical protein [Streptomyces sp. WAC08241]RSS37439.1 hypothetical protein EF906_22960 [Streptomyces sp. WAC08241]
MPNKINLNAIVLLLTSAIGGLTTGYLIRYTDTSLSIAFIVAFLTVSAIRGETRANRLAAAKTTAGS